MRLGAVEAGAAEAPSVVERRDLDRRRAPGARQRVGGQQRDQAASHHHIREPEAPRGVPTAVTFRYARARTSMGAWRARDHRSTDRGDRRNQGQRISHKCVRPRHTPLHNLRYITLVTSRSRNKSSLRHAHPRPQTGHKGARPRPGTHHGQTTWRCGAASTRGRKERPPAVEDINTSVSCALAGGLRLGRAGDQGVV